jgi:hypothetical protein
MAAAFRVRRRSGQDRLDSPDDRSLRVDRKTDRSRRPALHAEERRHRRRPQAGADPQGRHRPRAGDDQAHRPGADRAGEDRDPGRLRADAASAGDRARCNRSEGADDRHVCGDLDHSPALAVHRSHGIHATAEYRAHRRLGGEEQDQEGRHAGGRLRPGQRVREDVPQTLQGCRRNDHRLDPHAPRQSRLRAVPAARQGRQARRAVRFRAFGTGHRRDEAVR